MTAMFHQFWSKITAIVIGSFGPVFFFGAMTSTSAAARLTMDVLGLRLSHPSSFDAPVTRLLSAVTGGFLLGWGVTVWCLSSWVYPIAREPVRRAVVTGLLAWFFLDSAGSVASGHPSNAAFNGVVLLLAVGPLWGRAKD